MARLSVLQDRFGAVNDAVVAQRLASIAAQEQGGAAIRAAGFVCGYHAAYANVAVREIAPLWREFSQLQPFWRNPSDTAKSNGKSQWQK